MKFLSLDPSVNNVGWATFDSRLKGREQWKYGKWTLEGHNREMRLVDLRDHVRDDLPEFDHLIMEYPAFYSSEKGQIAAHNNYTIDLAHICGFISGSFGCDHRNYHPLTAIEWKGTVTKEITMRKFARIFKVRLKGLSDHEIDAVMMLRYWLQRYGPRVFRDAGEAFPVSPALQF